MKEETIAMVTGVLQARGFVRPPCAHNPIHWTRQFEMGECQVWGNSWYIPPVEHLYVQVAQGDDNNCLTLSQPNTEAELIESVDIAIEFLGNIDRLARRKDAAVVS